MYKVFLHWDDHCKELSFTSLNACAEVLKQYTFPPKRVHIIYVN